MSSARAADRTQWIARARRRGRGRPEIARSSRGRVADTGPCYTKYNTVLRGCGALAPPKLKEDFVKLTRGNKYVTTLHVINSAVVKLSKLTRVEPVYRGIRSGKLPWGFTEANAYNVKTTRNFYHRLSRGERRKYRQSGRYDELARPINTQTYIKLHERKMLEQIDRSRAEVEQLAAARRRVVLAERERKCPRPPGAVKRP